MLSLWPLFESWLHFINITVVNAAPSLKDLYQHITPQYAADWKVIGTLLGLPSGELNAIEAGYPTNVKWCCNHMFEKWLEMDPNPTWEKIHTAIKSPAVSSDQGADKKNIYIKYIYPYIGRHAWCPRSN